MALTTLTIRVDEVEADFLDRVASQHEGILSKQGVMRLLLQQAEAFEWDPVDKPITLEERATASVLTSKAVSTSKEKNLKKEKSPELSSGAAPKKRFVFSVPDDLADYKTELLGYWREDKGGKKSQAAASTLINGCRAIRDKYGDAVLRSQIEMARGYGWENITLAKYEQYGLPRSRGGNAPAQPEHKHPAYRDAADVLAEQERIAQQNIEHLRLKQAESKPAVGGVLDGLF